MERYKLPAGRLATVFYNVKQKDLVSAAATPDSSDTEKDALEHDELAPPVQRDVVTAQRTLESMSSHHGRTLTWMGITLKLRHDGEEKCLLDNLDGELGSMKLLEQPFSGTKITYFAVQVS